MSRQPNRIVFSGPHMTESEEAEWKDERIKKAIEYFRNVLEKFPQNQEEVKIKVQSDLASALIDLKNFNEAGKIYDELFFVST